MMNLLYANLTCTYITALTNIKLINLLSTGKQQETFDNLRCLEKTVASETLLLIALSFLIIYLGST